MFTEMFVCGVSVKYGHVITCIKNYGRTIITVTLCDPARGHIMGGRRVRLGMTSCLCMLKYLYDLFYNIKDNGFHDPD